MKRLGLVFASALLLTGCSLTNLFSMASKSDVEQAASEEVARSDRVRQKMDLITQKKHTSPRVTQLKPPGKDANTAIYAFGNTFAADAKSVIEVEAILSDPQGRTYEVWAGKPGERWPMHLGRLTLNRTDDYSFHYEATDDLSDYSIISLSLQGADQIATPSNILVTGTLSVASASPTPSK